MYDRHKCYSPKLSLIVFGSLIVFIIWILYSIRSNQVSVRTKQSFSTSNFDCSHQAVDTSEQILHPQWPPTNVHELLNERTKRYELSLRPVVIPDKSPKPVSFLQRYFQLLKILRRKNVERGSWHYRVYQMERELRIDPDAYNYHLFPQALDLEHVVREIRAGKPVNTPPINDPVLPILEAPKDICQTQANNTTTFDLLVLIKSCVRCQTERDHARRTFMQRKLWGDFRIRFVFVTGLPASNYSGMFHFDGLEIKHNSHGNEKNDTKRVREQLFEESMLHHDLLIGEFEDHYYCLTIKQLFTFRWVSAFCRGWSELFLFIDQDFAFIPRNLIRFINQIPSSVRTEIHAGIPRHNQVVIRPSKHMNKWSISESEFPWPRYAPYNSGQAYLLGWSLVSDLAVALSFIPPMRMDDANLGTALFKLHRPVYKTSWFQRKVRSPLRLNSAAIVMSRYTDRYMDWYTGNAKRFSSDFLQDFIYRLPP